MQLPRPAGCRRMILSPIAVQGQPTLHGSVQRSFGSRGVDTERIVLANGFASYLRFSTFSAASYEVVQARFSPLLNGNLPSSVCRCQEMCNCRWYYLRKAPHQPDVHTRSASAEECHESAFCGARLGWL